MGTIVSTSRDKLLVERQGYTVAPDGTYMTIWPTATAGQFVIMTSGDRGDTWTPRGNVTAPAGGEDTVDFAGLQIAQFTDGSMAIALRDNARTTIRYCKVTYGTWAVSAWETAAATVAGQIFGKFDIAVSDAGVVGIGLHFAQGSTSLWVQLRTRTTAGAWSGATSVALYSGGAARRWSTEAVSLVALNLVGGVRQWIVASGHGTATTDMGIETYQIRVTESTGAVVGTATQCLPKYFAGILDRTTLLNSHRIVRLFRTGTDEFSLMMANRRATGVPTWLLAVTRRSVISGVAYGTPWHAVTQMPAVHFPKATGRFGFSADENKNFIFRYAIFAPSSEYSETIASVYLTANNDSSFTVYDHLVQTSDHTALPASVLHSPSRDLTQVKHDFAYVMLNTNPSVLNAYMYKEAVPSLSGGNISRLEPVDGSANNIANPDLRVGARIGLTNSPSLYRPQYELARDSTFTTSLIQFTPAASFFKRLDSTSGTNSAVWYAPRLPSGYSLAKATWYIRARLVDYFGNVGAWSATQSFGVGHPPKANAIMPKNGIFNWHGGEVTFAWGFSDPSPTDTQTAYNVTASDASTGAVLYTSGKIASSVKYHTTTLAGTIKNKDVEWSVIVYDSEDTPSTPSAPVNFRLSDPPTVTITTPASNVVIGTSMPTINFGINTFEGRRIKEYSILVTQGAELIWSKRLVTDAASGATFGVKMDQGHLRNEQFYSVQVLTTDDGGLQGQSLVIPFSTSWVVPASPTGQVANPSAYNTDGLGYVDIVWADTARDADFIAWHVSRKSDMIDDYGVVVSEGEWVPVGSIYEIATSYSFKDYYAPSNYITQYSVVQSINRAGQDIDSNPALTPLIIPQSDGYWLIEPTVAGDAASAYKLSNVTGESFTPEQEEAAIVVIGRGRVVNKGQRLGRTGTLDAQLRNTDGTSARQKRMRLEQIQENPRQLFLRNPFGDIFQVSVSDMTITRIAGVGKAEFVDVSIPYSEVS